MDRNQAFGRLAAIATVLGDSVLDKGQMRISDKYLSRLQRKPADTFAKMHAELMQHAHKFKDYEMHLLDMFGEILASLNTEDFTDAQLKETYLRDFYAQRGELYNVVGVSEAAEILGWDKRRIATYISRGVFPEPVQRLASGPIWTRKQIEEYRDSRA